MSAFSGAMRWLGRGRDRVRRMIRSMSRSKNWFIAFAPPAASVPPNSVAATSQGDGKRPAARTIVGTVVMSSSTMMRGFVSWKYARVVWPREWRARIGSARWPLCSGATPDRRIPTRRRLVVASATSEPQIRLDSTTWATFAGAPSFDHTSAAPTRTWARNSTSASVEKNVRSKNRRGMVQARRAM